MPASLYTRLRRKYGTPTSPREQIRHTQLQTEQLRFPRQLLQQRDAVRQAQKSVIVIGAGFAGLSAGYHLAKNGFKVTVLEARDRVGGRVHSLRNFAAGQIIEAGAELVGSNHPLWIELAREFGIGFDVVTQDDMFAGQLLTGPLSLNGHTLNDDEAAQIFDYMNRILGDMVSMAEGIDADAPWNSPRAQEWDSIRLKDYLDRQVDALYLEPQMRELLDAALDVEFSFNNAVPAGRQSMLAMLTLIKAGGGQKYWDMTEVYRCSNGNDFLAQQLAEYLKQHGHTVLLNRPVSEVKLIEDEGVVITAISKDEELKETDKKETDPKTETYKADYVVLSAPPSVWGRIDIGKDLSGLQPQMGDAVKFLSVLDTRYWIKQGLAPSGLSSTLGMTWEGSDNQVFSPGKQIDLSVFTGATLAQELSGMDEQARKDRYYQELEALLPGYEKHVRDTRFQNWPMEEWTMAGYSFPYPGEVCTKIKTLNEMYKKRLSFAGEHTWMGFVGYMEGALQSGLAACNRISEAAGNTISDELVMENKEALLETA